MTKEILKIENLKTYFDTWAGVVKAVDGVSLNVMEGETLGLVGESGSGKSVTALSILGIVPRPGKIVEGKIIYKGENLVEKQEKELQKFRGKEIAYIVQDPATSLNPVFSVGDQLIEVIKTDKPVLSFSPFMRLLIPEAQELFAKRVEVISCWINENNRAVFDQAAVRSFFSRNEFNIDYGIVNEFTNTRYPY